MVNRRVKGEDRNVGRARERAIDERKKKLLQELQSSKKSNAFVDHRFGEQDANMSLEEKMFLRFQQEKTKRARNKSLYNLDSNDTEFLTHKGSILNEENMAQDDVNDDVSDDENLGREVVQNLHFGGGMRPKTSENTDDKPRKSREDTLQEIVMKSKLHKLEKKEAKDAQELDRERLDLAYDELVKSALLDFKPKRRDRAEDEVKGPKADEFGDYDVALRTMLYESRVQATDRTKSAEEVAAEAKRRLEDLEAARLQRMLRESNSEEQEAEGAFKRAKTRPRNDDELGDDNLYEGYESRKDYLLHHDFGAEAGGHEAAGGGDDDVDDGEDEEVVDEEDEDEDEEDDLGEEDSEDDGEDDREDEEADSDQGDESEEAIEGEDEEGEGQHHGSLYRRWLVKRKLRIEQELQSSTVNPNMPHNIASPMSLPAFDELIETYVHSDEDLRALVDRILVWNSVKLPGKEGIANRGRMHNFLDVLIKHFIRVGDSISGEAGNMAVVGSVSLTIFSASLTVICSWITIVSAS